MHLLFFCFASLNPLLEQVLVVAVRPGPERVHSFMGELAAVGVDEHGHKAVVFAGQTVDQLRHLVHSLLERWKKRNERAGLQQLWQEACKLMSDWVEVL